jgi:two-component system nitrate/nitrite response regulator NarL
VEATTRAVCAKLRSPGIEPFTAMPRLVSHPTRQPLGRRGAESAGRGGASPAAVSRESPDAAAVVARSEPPLRVLVVDDDPLVRRALREALEGVTWLEVAGEASSGEEAVAAAAADRPDLVLMDVDMPGVDGVTATIRLGRVSPGLPVILLSASPDDELGFLGLEAGAVGFLGKDVAVDALRRALAGVSRGEAAISRTLTLRLVEHLRKLSERTGGMRPIQSRLTPREWQVLDLMGRGAGTDDIAHELVLSTETVRSHIKHILAKLGVHSREKAIDVARRLRQEGVGDSAPLYEPDELAFKRALDRLLPRGEER